MKGVYYMLINRNLLRQQRVYFFLIDTNFRLDFIDRLIEYFAIITNIYLDYE